MAVIRGTNSSETVTGTSASETLLGLGGNDTILGLEGDDALVGGAGNDSLAGGSGNDSFVYDARDFDIDTITDLETGDRIDLAGLNIGDFAQLVPYMSQNGSDVHIEFRWGGGVERIVVAGKQIADLSASNFLFNSSADPLVVSGTNSHDTLFGGLGNDLIFGGGGNDSLNAGGGNDALNGGTGDDLLRGGAGNDRFIYSTRGFDIDTIADFSAGDRIDLRGLNVASFSQLLPFITQIGANVEIRLQWGGGAERIIVADKQLADITASSFLFNGSLSELSVDGTGSHDVLFGGNGNDIIRGGGGNDSLSGGGGNDVLDGGSGNDQLRGGNGGDQFVYADRSFGADTILDFGAGDRIDVSGLNIGDFSQLAPFMSQIGNDVRIALNWGGGAETITIANTQLASVTAGYFLFNTDLSELLVEGTGSHDVLFGGKGADFLFGYGGNDNLSGGAADDVLNGGSGNDVLRGGAGDDRFAYSGRDFGADTIMDFAPGDHIDLRALNIGDISQLTPFMSQVGANVQINFQWGGGGERIVIANTQLASITADSFLFNGGSTSRLAEGTGSHDTLFGGNGNDQLFGYGGNDSLNGGAGVDVLKGGTGNDVLRGGAGNDRFLYDDRGFGIDTIADFTMGDRIDLSALNIGSLSQLTPFMSQIGADVQIDFRWGGGTERIVIANTQLANINAASFVFNGLMDPAVVSGTGSHDTLFGGIGNDHLFGYGGNDSLSGGDGNDVLVGGTGLDSLRGGAGADRFVYAVGDGGGSQIDAILDFSSLEGDKIDLSGIDPFAEAGDQALSFVTGMFTEAGQTRLIQTASGYQVQVNLDDNLSTIELAVNILGVGTLSVGDLVL